MSLRCTLIAALLLTSACANESNRASTTPTVRVAADDAKPRAREPKPSPAQPQAKDLTLRVIGTSSYALPPLDALALRQIDALGHPLTLDYVPGGISPSSALMRSVMGRNPGPDWTPGPADIADIQRALPSIQARQNAERDAQLRYERELGKLPRALHVAPAAVDLALRLHNPTARVLHVKVSGDATARRLVLTGPGAAHMYGGGDGREIFMCGKWATIQPGAHLDLPMKRLSYGDRAHELGAIWTKPGTYQLTVGFDTSVAEGPLPDDCGGGHRGGVEHRQLVSPPMAIDVR